LQRIADEAGDALGDKAIYRDPTQPATRSAGEVPALLQSFAADAVRAALRDPDAMARALGEYLTEPKANVWFESGDAPELGNEGVKLDRRTRMMYDARHVFINGESLRAAGRDAKLMHALADARCLTGKQLAAASADARSALESWIQAGWAHPLQED
jgi:50S ribosomal protein L16 3-hydroxylase